MSNQKKSYYYAVQNGRSTGVFNSWSECESEVKGFKGAKFKKFETVEEARNFAGASTNSSYSEPSCNYSSPRTASYSKGPSVARTTYNRSPSPDYSTTSYVSQTRYSPPPAANSCRITSQPVKRKYSDNDYERDYKQSKYVHSAPQHSKKKTSVVYTDGASSNNGKHHARAGFGVYWGDNDPRNASVRLLSKKQTNQRAEASAVIHALEQSLDGTEPLEIRTDSKYVIDAVESWSKNWVKKGWKNAKGQEVENRDLFEKLLDLKQKRKGEVRFTHVPGHQGVEGNEKADQLAVAGAKK